MLTVTMTTPTSYYLRGFVGETYAGGRWTPLDSASLAESAGTFYWLHQDGFRSLTQLTAAARAAAPELLGHRQYRDGGKYRCVLKISLRALRIEV